MSIQLNLSQDEVDFINTILFNSTMQIGTLEHINAREIVTKIQYQAKPQWVHVGNKPSPQWTKEDSEPTCNFCGIEIKVPVVERYGHHVYTSHLEEYSSNICWDCWLEPSPLENAGDDTQ